jgi:hypothetical protein
MPNSIQLGRTDNDFAAVTPLGANQAAAAPLTGGVNHCNTTVASTGVILPTAASGPIVVRNTNGTNALAVYPPVGGAVNAGTLNAASSLAVNTTAVFYPHPNGLDFTRVG